MYCFGNFVSGDYGVGEADEIREKLLKSGGAPYFHTLRRRSPQIGDNHFPKKGTLHIIHSAGIGVTFLYEAEVKQKFSDTLQI